MSVPARKFDTCRNSLHALLRPLQISLHFFRHPHSRCKARLCTGESPLSQSLQFEEFAVLGVQLAGSGQSSVPDLQERCLIAGTWTLTFAPVSPNCDPTAEDRMNRSGGCPCSQAGPRWQRRCWNRSRCGYRHSGLKSRRPRKTAHLKSSCCLRPLVVIRGYGHSAAESAGSSRVSVAH
jgi:hypothetical protein